MYEDDVRAWMVTLNAKTTEAFANACALAQASITDGSAITGAPGQPVDTGTLKASFILAFESPTLATISTNIAYAPVIEEGVRAAYDPEGVQPKRASMKEGGTRRIKSTTGGHHSIKMTVAGWQRIVDAASRGSRL